MDRPENLHDETPGTHTVPALIHDYRAQREAWREQARNLARMREEVLTAADREARDIVTTARADVRRILLKARRDLLVLAAQVRAAGRPINTDETPEAVNLLPADDLLQGAGNVLTTARHDVRRVLDESRPELEGLASEGEALRAALRPHRPLPPAPIDVRTRITPTPADSPYTVHSDASVAESPLDFDFTSTREEGTSGLAIPHVRRPVRVFVVAAATIGCLALMGTGWWLFKPSSDAAPAEAAVKRPGDGSASAASRTTAGAGERRSPIPEQRGGLSLHVEARRASWMRVTADGRVLAERIFKPGETQQVRATNEVSIRAGDAGAVLVAVDGRQPVALGREGEVITRRFGVNGSRAPATPPRVPVAQSVPQRVTNRPASSTTTPVDGTPAPKPAQPLAVTAPSVTLPPSVASPAAGRGGVADSAVTPAAAPTTTAAATRPAVPPTAPAPPASLRDSLTSLSTRWLDAYYRQDRATMTAISSQTTVSDDRGERERLPRGLTGVRRSLEDVNFQQMGAGTAMLTARMRERMDDASAGKMAEAVSFISHIYTNRNGTWQIDNVQIVSASSLSRALSR